jgi:hypothetical protein
MDNRCRRFRLKTGILYYITVHYITEASASRNEMVIKSKYSCACSCSYLSKRERFILITADAFRAVGTTDSHIHVKQELKMLK